MPNKHVQARWVRKIHVRHSRSLSKAGIKKYAMPYRVFQADIESNTPPTANDASRSKRGFAARDRTANGRKESATTPAKVMPAPQYERSSPKGMSSRCE